MIHRIPIGLSADDIASVNEILQDPPMSGGAAGYELVDGEGTVAAQNFRDAGVHFINTTWPTSARVGAPYAPGVPVSVRDAVVGAVERGDLCTCGAACTDPECDTRAFAWARAYIEAYEKKAARAHPPKVTVRHAGEVRTFTPTLSMLTEPTPDAIRDGVIAKMRIKIT